MFVKEKNSLINFTSNYTFKSKYYYFTNVLYFITKKEYFISNE